MVSIQDDHLSEVSLFAICLLLFVFFPILIHDHIDMMYHLGVVSPVVAFSHFNS